MKSLIIGEVSNGTLSSGTLEIITKAQENNLDFKLVVIGTENNPKIGSDTFEVNYVQLSPDELSLSSVADTLVDAIKTDSIELVLASSTYVGRDISGFLSVDLNSSPVANVINFEINGSTLTTTNSIDGGESEYFTNVTSDVKILIIRPKSFEASDVTLSENYTISSVEKNDITVNVFDVFIEEKTGPQLEDSKIVISAGRGMVDVGNLKYIEDLAGKLNAAIGGTRAIVDAGWMPYKGIHPASTIALVPPIAALSLPARSSIYFRFPTSTIPLPAEMTILESSSCGPVFSSINTSKTLTVRSFFSTELIV